MNLRDALDLCTDAHGDDWITVPGSRPATTMVAGLFDPGMRDPRTRPLTGHTIAVYEPDARLSLVWPVPEDDDHFDRLGRADDGLPEWAENDTFDWRRARLGTVVVLLGGSPIWQARVWYLDWGSGVGGYVCDFQPRFGDRDEDGVPSLDGWEATAWMVGLARLLNAFSMTGQFYTFDPTDRLVPSPSRIHPVQAAREAFQ